MDLLPTGGDDSGFIVCALCGGDAAGPCARCRIPVCGNCCVLTEGSASPWAVCVRCARREGTSMGRGWSGVIATFLVPIAVLFVVVIALALFVGGR